MGVSDEAKNVIPLKFLSKIKNKNFFPLVNSIRGHTVQIMNRNNKRNVIKFTNKFEAVCKENAVISRLLFNA
jgi:hypothetical protein